MTEITSTICRPKQKQSWLTAPGIQRVEKIPLERAIEEVFNVLKGSLTDKHRKREKCDAKHLYRYIIERILKTGELADQNKARVIYGREKYISYHKKRQQYHVQMDCQQLGIKKDEFFNDEMEAIEYVRNILNEYEKDISKYSLSEIGIIANCDHATVLHSCNVARNLIETDKVYRAKAQTIFDRITNNQITLP